MLEAFIMGGLYHIILITVAFFVGRGVGKKEL